MMIVVLLALSLIYSSLKNEMLPSLCTKSGGKVHCTSNISDRWHLKTDATPFGEKRYRNLKHANEERAASYIADLNDTNTKLTLAMNKLLLSTDVSKIHYRMPFAFTNSSA